MDTENTMLSAIAIMDLDEFVKQETEGINFKATEDYSENITHNFILAH
jgi:hypothetical protein